MPRKAKPKTATKKAASTKPVVKSKPVKALNRARSAMDRADALTDKYLAEAMPRPADAKFEVRNATGDRAEIDLYDVIGTWAVSAASFRAQLRQIKAKEIDLRINSPGGSVTEAAAIYNDLIAHHAKVNVKIVGLAASAASVIAMAGDDIQIADNSFLMIHNAWAVVVGDKNDMTHVSGILAKMDESSIASAYIQQTGMDAEEILDLMAEETWFTASEAVANGFAHSIIEDEDDVQGSFDVSSFVNAPAVLKSGKVKSGSRKSASHARHADSDFSQLMAAAKSLNARFENGAREYESQIKTAYSAAS